MLSDSLQNLRKELILMARSSEQIFEQSCHIIWNKDPAQLEKVRQMDHEIDSYEMRIDEMCIGYLLKEPYAHDLRFVIGAIKNIKEFERIGDQSKTIGKWSMKLTTPPPQAMKALVEKTAEALSASVQALVDENVAHAEKAMELEFQVDELEDQIIENSNSIAEAFIAKAIERIGDLATNVAENVIFYLQAQDIRHGRFHNAEK